MLNLTELLDHYGTEEQCSEALYRWRWPDGFRCPRCGNDRFCQLTFRGLRQCNGCRVRSFADTGGPARGATVLQLFTANT